MGKVPAARLACRVTEDAKREGKLEEKKVKGRKEGEEAKKGGKKTEHSSRRPVSITAKTSKERSKRGVWEK